MDLYKYAMWFSPFVGSDLIADSFSLARDARELDMRAAPYDLASLGYEPIRVETLEGRRDYAARQRRIAERSRTLRERLLNALTNLVDRVPSRGGVTRGRPGSEASSHD
jgi:hypothetical protein